MRQNIFLILVLVIACPSLALSSDLHFYETVPLIGKLVMLLVAFSVPGILIFSHIGLFEYLDTDEFPKPPSLSREQQELLSGTIVGLVFGVLLTVVFMIIS